MNQPDVNHLMCHWFAACPNQAVQTLRHPVLGEVPICQRCLDWYNRVEYDPLPEVKK